MDELLRRHIAPIADQLMRSSPALLIEGARQIGKSTLARVLTAGTDAVFTTLDDESVRAAAAEDMPGFVAQARGRTLVIDEVQRLPELTLALKAAIDRHRSPGRFILTGSASLLRARGLSDSLGGRFIAGIVLSTGERGFRLADRLYGLPVDALWRV